MPLSTMLFLACMQMLRWLFFATAVLLVVLAVKAQFDPSVALTSLKALLAAGVFALTGVAVGVLRGAVARRLRRN